MSEAIIFTDGASQGNPGSGGWGAVISVTEESADTGRVMELGGHLKETTNNQAELTAAIEVLQWARNNKLSDVTLYTDSSYLIQGITNWRHNWQQNGWQTKNDEPVKNKQLWQDLISAQEDLGVTYEHVDGHAGIPANERADDVATTFADGSQPDLFSGSKEQYDTSLAPETQKITDAPVYISLVDDQVKQHTSWEDCKQRVEGVEAQYRKVKTIPERDQILKDWGKSPGDVAS